MGTYVGLDVHSKQTFYCIQNEQGVVVGEGSIATAEEVISQWVSQMELAQGTPVGLETGTQSKWVARVLSQLQLCPHVIDAYEVRAKTPRRATKCDRRDAFVICDGIRRGLWTSDVWVPTAEIDRLREILSRRRHFVRICTRQINAAKFLMRTHGLAPATTLQTRTAWHRLLARDDVQSVRIYLAMHFDLWDKASCTVDELEAQLREALEPFAHAMQLLQSLFGTGLITAATVIAALGDPHRFATSKHVVAFAGLAPSIYDSGDQQRHGHITRQGSPSLRAALCEAAHQARRRRHPLNPYMRRLVPKCGLKRAVTAVAARTLQILWRMWRDDVPFDLKKLNVVYRPGTRTSHYLYAIKQEVARSLPA